MKISELIERLQKIQDEHGDLPIRTCFDTIPFEIDDDESSGVYVYKSKTYGKLVLICERIEEGDA